MPAAACLLHEGGTLCEAVPVRLLPRGAASRPPATPRLRAALPAKDVGAITSQDLGDLSEFGCDESGCAVNLFDELAPEFSVKLLEDPSGEFASVEASEVRRFLTRPAGFVYDIEEVTSSGRLSRFNMSRGDLLALTQLSPRDLRAVAVQPLPGADMGPILTSRRQTLLLGLGDVRAIVEPTRALMFGPASRDRTRFLRVLANQWRATPRTSFRMAFVESALLTLSRTLDSRLVEVRRIAEPRLQRAPARLLEPDLEEVRLQRRVLVRCASQASAISSTLLSRLEDEDVAQLAGGETMPGEDAAEEWEVMLEVYLTTYLEISRECTSLISDIEDFEGSVSLSLQTRRLRVEQFELSLVGLSASVGLGGLVPSTLGMNLLNSYESSESAFGTAVAATVVVILALWVVLRALAVRGGFLT